MATGKKLVLVVGFGYGDCEESLRLPSGILVDIYLAYRHALEIAADRILVITDFEVGRANIPYDMVIEGHLGSDLLEFLGDLVRSKEIRTYSHSLIFKKDLQTFIKEGRQIIFFYTGHAQKGKIVLPFYRPPFLSFHESSKTPQVDYIDLKIVLKWVIEASDPQARILGILDACPPHDTGLKYLWGPRGSSALPRGDLKLGQRRLTVIASTTGQELAYASRRGSFFTAALFALLREKTSKKDALGLEELPGRIFVSHPHLQELGYWVTTPTKIEVTYEALRGTYRLFGRE